jgi:LL-H family phage holin
MNPQTLALVQVLIPTVVAAIVYIYHQAVHHLPAKEQAEIARQQASLEQFVPHAVQMSEQIADPNTSGREKKMVAMNILKGLLTYFKVDVPSDEVLSSLIESTVYAIKQQQSPPISPVGTA